MINEDKKADNNKQIKYPKTIKVKRADIQNQIELDGNEFLDLINNDKINVVFKGFDWEEFFIVKEGCCFNTESLDFEEFEEYYKKLEHLKKEGITEPEGYKEAIELGINDYEQYKVYTSYKASDFQDLEQYIKATKLGFQYSDEYKKAIELGIDNHEDYTSFVESGFYSDNGYRYNGHATKQNYEEYLKAKKLGFQDKNEYNEAMELGFSNPAQYQEFLGSGCETKEEFEFLKKMPQIVKNMNKKINEIVHCVDLLVFNNRFFKGIYRFLQDISGVILHSVVSRRVTVQSRFEKHCQSLQDESSAIHLSRGIARYICGVVVASNRSIPLVITN